MNLTVRLCLVVAALFATGTAHAQCSVAADPGATERLIRLTTDADGDLLVSMTMVPKLTRVDYRSAEQKPDCDLGALTTTRGGYRLWGSDSGSRQRKALPDKAGEPIALVIPVFDMKTAIESATSGKPAPIQGYMLATVTRRDLTGWRFYTAMPDVAVLRRDMADALAGTGTPIFRNGADGRTALFAPKG